MKPLFVVFLSMLCCNAIAQTGNVKNDASLLKAKIESKNVKDVLDILSLHMGFEDNVLLTDLEKIRARINENNFLIVALTKNGIRDSILKDDLKPFYQAYLVKAKLFRARGAVVQGFALDEIFPANIVADGLGTFIAERFKEELTMRYLEEFRRKLTEKDITYHYSILLPQTFLALKEYENVFDYKSFITTLKESFKNDLDDLSRNLLPFLEAHKSSLQVADNEFYMTLTLFDIFINQVPQVGNPLRVFAEIDSNLYFQKIPGGSSEKNVLALISVLAAELKNNSGNFLSGDEASTLVKDLTSDAMTAQLYFGLLLEKNKTKLSGISLGSNTAFKIINQKSADIKDLIFLYQSLGKLPATISKLQSDKDVIAFLTEINSVAKNVVTILAKISSVNEVALRLQKSLEYADHFINIEKYAKEEKYGLVIVELLKVLDLTGLKSKNAELYEITKKYGLFISNVAQAKTGAEVKEALDVAAMPVGSYRIKRNAIADISFNAYAGLSGGYEWLRQDADEMQAADISNGGIIGFSVPVGLAFSWGIHEKAASAPTASAPASPTVAPTTNYSAETITHKRLHGSSITVFFSFIDVGAITSYRLTNDDVENLPEFSWENILAPGLHIIYGIKNSPLSFGIGAQQGPQLRKFENATTTGELVNSFSLKASLTVDIPIFNFYTKAQN